LTYLQQCLFNNHGYKDFVDIVRPAQSTIYDEITYNYDVGFVNLFNQFGILFKSIIALDDNLKKLENFNLS
jgi:hypothetical protein